RLSIKADVPGAAEETQVTRISARANEPFLDRFFDRAALFVRVRAIRKGAQRHERAEFGEESLDFFGNDVPELELADAGRIDDPAAEVELDEFGGRRRVSPFLAAGAHFADAQA